MHIKRDQINKAALYGLFGLAVILFQTVFSSKLTLLGVKPSLLYSSTILVAMYEGYVTGMIFGGAVGFICDATAGRFDGTTGILLVLTGFVIGYFAITLIRRNLLSVLLLFSLSTAAADVIVLFLYLLIYGNLHSTLLLSGVMLREFVYSILFVPLMYLIEHFIFKHLSVLE